jgi:hypothetical protein
MGRKGPRTLAARAGAAAHEEEGVAQQVQVGVGLLGAQGGAVSHDVAVARAQLAAQHPQRRRVRAAGRRPARSDGPCQLRPGHRGKRRVQGTPLGCVVRTYGRQLRVAAGWRLDVLCPSKSKLRRRERIISWSGLESAWLHDRPLAHGDRKPRSTSRPKPPHAR